MKTASAETEAAGNEGRAGKTPTSRGKALRSQEAQRQAAYTRFDVRLDEAPLALRGIDSMGHIAQFAATLRKVTPRWTA